ncbi:uncharacterized protein LOC119578997 [Penaeus monodon]|uniref:uncharacterized protein LOC119578997 n=1 Tax=Penaeus monodon TaxID=6687 RepID=UPI0018A7AB4B|nr:uncharacterized protein LOC119578997 [Penaeus monodon]
MAETAMATEPPTTTSGPDRATSGPTTTADLAESEMTTEQQESDTASTGDGAPATEPTETGVTQRPGADISTDIGEQTGSPGTTPSGAQGPDAATTTEQSGSPGTAPPGGQGPDAANTTDGEQTGSPGTALPGGQGTDAGNTTDGEQTGSPGTAPPGGQGPDAGNTTDGEQTGSPGTAPPGAQGPDAGNTTDGGQSGSPGTAPPGGQGPDAANTTDGAPPGAQGPDAGNTTDGGQSGSPGTAPPGGQGPSESNVTGGAPATGVPVTQGPGVGNTEDGEPDGQYNTTNFGQYIASYFTLGTGNDTSIPLNFGRDIVSQLRRKNSTVFRFNLQVRTSGAITKAFDSLSMLATLSSARQETEITDEENEEGTSDTSFVSALDRVNKTSTINNTDCINTIKLVLMKVQFINASTGELYPCDRSNQANAPPPYVEIVDIYNNSMTQRYCYLDENVTIHSFGDQMYGSIVTTGDPNIIPDIRAIQSKEKYCCGGVFYGDFRKPLVIASPNYPSSYNADMRCPYVFRCSVDYPECVIRIDFENFNLDPNAMHRSRRQAESGNATLAPYVPPTGPDFNRTICAGEDGVRVSQCGSISAANSRSFCAANPPSQVYTGYKEVLMYFNSNDERQNQGFVVKFTPKDKRKWIYSDAELDPECVCAHTLPNQIRKFFRQRNKNKNKKNKSKAKNTSLRRVKRGERKNLKEKRKAEKKDRIPGKKKTEKGRNKKNTKEQAKRKGKLFNKKEERRGKMNKNGEEVDKVQPDERALNGRTNRKRQQYPWLVSVTQYERPLLEGKSTSDRPIERVCGGTLLSDSYILTTTSCCTYCG